MSMCGVKTGELLVRALNQKSESWKGVMSRPIIE